MALFIAGKSTCALCGKVVASASEAVGFPAFVPPGHKFHPYSDAIFHRTCFESWSKHDTFLRLYDKWSDAWAQRPKDPSDKDAVRAWLESVERALRELD